MHQRLENLIKALSEADPQTDIRLLRAFVLEELFLIAGGSQCVFTPIIGKTGNLPLTMTFFTIAPSGSGKSAGQNTVNRVFRGYKKVYRNMIQELKGQYNDGIQAEAIAKFGEYNEKNKSKHDAYFKQHASNGFNAMYTQTGTTQGMSHALDAMRRLKIGSYACRIDECSSFIISKSPDKQDFSDSLLSFSGGASIVSRSLKGEVSELDATGVAFNLHFFGNSEELQNNERSLQQLHSFLRKGFARRSLFTYVKEKKYIQREWLDFEPDESRFDTMNKHFAQLFERLVRQENKVFTFDDEAKAYMKDYFCENQYPTGDHDVDVEKGDHVFKGQKIACILALFEGSFLVSKAHCESAMQYIILSSSAYRELLYNVQEEVFRHADSYPIQIFDSLRHGNALSKRELSRKLKPIPRDITDAKFSPLIEEAGKVAEEEGFFLIKETTKNGRGTQYRLEQIQTTPEAKVTYSVKAPDVPEEPKRCLGTGYELQTTTLEEMCLYGSFLHVSPAVFKGGHRKSENVEYLGNLAFFDVDNDVPSNAMLTIEDARLRLKGYQGAVIESMSSTIEQPRFRIVVVLDKLVKGISKDTYKRVLNNIAKHLGIDGAIDKACVEPSRYYAQTCREAGEGVTYANLYGRPLAWEQFIEDNAVVSRPTVHAIAEVDVSEDEVKRRFSKAVKTAIKRHWRVGTRNNLAYYLVKLGREKGLLDSEIEALIAIESSGEGVPLDHKELKAVVTNAGRY